MCTPADDHHDPCENAKPDENLDEQHQRSLERTLPWNALWRNVWNREQYAGEIREEHDWR